MEKHLQFFLKCALYARLQFIAFLKQTSVKPDSFIIFIIVSAAGYFFFSVK